MPLGDFRPGGAAEVTASKRGWACSRRFHEVIGEFEREESGSRCTVLLGFHADPAWRMHVVSEPEGSAPRVKMHCDTCPVNAETDFVTGWTHRQSLTFQARFLQRRDAVAGQLLCAASLEVREFQIATRFSYRDLIRRLPPACLDPFVLARIQHLVPDFISVRPVGQ